MKSSVKYSLALALVVVIATVFWIKHSPNESASLNSIKDDGIKSKSVSTPVLPKPNGEATKSSVAVVKKELPTNPYLTKESLTALPPTMKEFLLLDMKSIKSAEETKKFYELLRSSVAIEDAQKVLLSIKLENLAESEREHLTSTRFLSRALGDLNNKSNTALNEIVKKIILKENLSGSMPEKAKMVFAGDKAELVHTLIAFNPGAYKELLAKTKNSNIKKIVENAYNYNQSMRVSNQ